jgi:sodium ion-translocating decarboxylase beta subunit
MIDHETIGLLLKGINNVTWQSLVMLGVSFVLMYLAIVKDYEPLLLLPIAAGCMLANLPLSPLIADDGMLKLLYNFGVTNELYPLLVFVGIGALTDFGPLLENPRLILIGAAGQFGIFLTLILALLIGFTPNEAASIGIIGAIDGPTSIYVSGLLAPHMLGPITVAAYSYMSLVPIILPPIMKLLTTQKERQIRMPYSSRKISRRTRIMFPIVVTVLVGTLVPFATPLIGMLMLGNLMKESGAVERLTKASAAEIANTVTLFLGLAIGSTMVGTDFLKPEHAGHSGARHHRLRRRCRRRRAVRQVLNWISGGKVNPLIGAAGISAFPMAARVVQRVAQDEDFENFLLMHAMGANAAGQVASVVAGGVVLALMGAGG